MVFYSIKASDHSVDKRLFLYTAYLQHTDSFKC